MPPEPAFEYGNPFESPGFVLWRTSSAWQRTIRDALAPSGLTHVQFVLLATTAWISARTGTLPTQRAIGELAGSDANTVSDTLRRMEATGLVHRRVSDTDSRVRLVSLADHGSTVLADAIPAVEHADRKFFADPAQQHLLSRVNSLAQASGPR